MVQGENENEFKLNARKFKITFSSVHLHTLLEMHLFDVYYPCNN